MSLSDTFCDDTLKSIIERVILGYDFLKMIDSEWRIGFSAASPNSQSNNMNH